MSDDHELTYDEVVVALADIAAAGSQVQVYIAGQKGAFVAGLAGMLRPVDDAFADELRPMYVAHGGDEELVAYHVHAGEHSSPCFVLCRSLFETARAVETDELRREEVAGIFWRALTIFVGGVALNIGVQSEV